MKKGIAFIVAAMALTLSAQAEQNSSAKKFDTEGREIVKGPLGVGVYRNIHIISDTVGIISYTGAISVEDSVIEAPVCIKTNGYGNTVVNTELRCGLGIEFTSGPFIENTFMNNSFSGQGTSRPDIFGW